jgi:biotin-dependent carboxylase-like uncharacterized protein
VWIDVIDPGPSTTVQDRGRAGHGHEGVPPSGALDGPAYARANRLVGNPAGAAGLETTLRGPRVLVGGAGVLHLAVTGAPAPLWVDGRPAAIDAAVAVRSGAVVEIGACSSGVRSYVAFAGGLDVPETLGSRSTDVLSGLGPDVLAAGDRLAVGPPGRVPAVDLAPASAPGVGAAGVLEVVPGPRLDRLAPDAAAELLSARWVVSATGNRIGLRLTGPVLAWAETGELPPEAVVTGAVQVPPGGQPIVFLRDHPVTGGYPVVAVVTDRSLPVAAQARPGDTIRFVAVPPPSGLRRGW